MKPNDPTPAKESPSSDASSPALPEFIGAYKIESLLKRGGMSLIYLATHPKTFLPVVIKVVLPKYLKTKEILSRLLREAKILSIVSHPNIVKLYDLGRSEQGLFIAMEFVQGVSLRQFIKQHSLTHKRALEIILQVAYALAHLHSQGIIHRDLKPDNILITESGNIKLIDFGISQFVATEDFEYKTTRRAFMGTPNYMSPEQKEHPEQVSYEADIFSLGIITYELYLGHSAYGVVQSSLLPKSLQKIIDKSLQRNPTHRYRDIVDFIADLSQFFKKIDEKDREEPTEEIYELTELAKEVLLSKTPAWPLFDIGLSVRKTSILGTLYVDFFSLTPTRYAIVLAKPLEVSSKALFLASVFRGYMRAIASQYPLEPLPKWLEMLAQVLEKERLEQKYKLALLFLDAERGSLTFASCQLGSLLYFGAGSQHPRILKTDNAPLQAQFAAPFLDIQENWDMESVLLFSSFSTENIHSLPLANQLVFSSQILADKAFEILQPTFQEHEDQALIALKRL